MTSRDQPAYEPKLKSGETDPLVNSNMDKGTIVLLETLYGALFRAKSEAEFQIPLQLPLLKISTQKDLNTGKR